MVPRPRTRPRPPVVVAATSAATAELAAARGLPMLLGMHIGDDGKQEMIACYRAAAARHHRRPAGGHIAAVMAYVADTRAQAQRTLRRELPRWLGPGLAGYVRVDGHPGQARDPDGYAEMLCRIHPVGTAADCVAGHGHDRTSAPGSGTSSWMVEGAGDPAARAGEHRQAGCRGAARPEAAVQQSTSSGRWLRICARAVMNSL